MDYKKKYLKYKSKYLQLKGGKIYYKNESIINIDDCGDEKRHSDFTYQNKFTLADKSTKELIGIESYNDIKKYNDNKMYDCRTNTEEYTKIQEYYNSALSDNKENQINLFSFNAEGFKHTDLDQFYKYIFNSIDKTGNACDILCLQEIMLQSDLKREGWDGTKQSDYIKQFYKSNIPNEYIYIYGSTFINKLIKRIKDQYPYLYFIYDGFTGGILYNKDKFEVTNRFLIERVNYLSEEAKEEGKKKEEEEEEKRIQGLTENLNPESDLIHRIQEQDPELASSILTHSNLTESFQSFADEEVEEAQHEVPKEGEEPIKMCLVLWLQDNMSKFIIANIHLKAQTFIPFSGYPSLEIHYIELNNILTKIIEKQIKNEEEAEKEYYFILAGDFNEHFRNKDPMNVGPHQIIPRITDIINADKLLTKNLVIDNITEICCFEQITQYAKRMARENDSAHMIAANFAYANELIGLTSTRVSGPLIQSLDIIVSLGKKFKYAETIIFNQTDEDEVSDHDMIYGKLIY